MRKGTKKALIITGSTIGGLIVVIVVAGAFLVTTQTGLKFILAHAGGKVHVGSVKGSLVGPFTLRDVTLDTDSAKVHVDRLNAHWKPGALLSGTLDIQQLTLAGIDVWRHPSTEPTTSSGPPKLKPPISVNIDKLELKNARVHGAKKNSKPFVIKSDSLSGKFTKHNLNVRHIEAHGPLFDIAGGAEVAPGGDYSTQGKIQFALRMPDYAPATGRLDLDGTLHALKIVASVASPYNARATLHADALATPVAMRAQAKLDGMHLHAVHAAWPSIALTSTARAKGTAKKLAYSLRSALKGGKIGTLDIALDGSWTKPVAKIEKLAITRPDSPMKLTATGQADTGGASPKASMPRLAW
jgi:autotransporter translocation and assembly factor TamB